MGSACLANICFFYKIPMHFVPLLTEQYYWAKNYYHHTKGSGFGESIQFEPSVEVTEYLRRVSKSMQKTDAAKNLLKLLSA